MKSSPASLLVIDANLAVRTLIPLGDGVALRLVECWQQEDRRLFAPELWLAETTSVIRRMAYAGMITSQEGMCALQDIAALGVQVVAADVALCVAAYQWSERLNQAKAYDGFYLALAERLRAEQNSPVEFWTADSRLYHQAQQVGVSWVRQP